MNHVVPRLGAVRVGCSPRLRVVTQVEWWHGVTPIGTTAAPIGLRVKQEFRRVLGCKTSLVGPSFTPPALQPCTECRHSGHSVQRGTRDPVQPGAVYPLPHVA